jgi:predicted Zn-dependent protease
MRVSRRIFRIAIVATLLGGLAIGCASSRERERRRWEDRAGRRETLRSGEERVVGARLATLARAQRPGAGDPVVDGYLQSLGDRIARLSDRSEIPYTFEALRDSEPRAFSLPGGYVFVTTGLLARLSTQSELAGILAHEVSHIAGRDPLERLYAALGSRGVAAILASERGKPPVSEASRGFRVLLDGYSKTIEAEADRSSLRYVARVGLDPRGYPAALAKLADAGGMAWEGSSWTPSARLVALEAEVKAMGLDAGLPNDPDPYARIRARLR